MSYNFDGDLLDKILHHLSKRDYSFKSKLREELCLRYTDLEQEKLQRHIIHLETANNVLLTRVMYYRVENDRFVPQESIQINIDRLKCIEIIQIMVDLLKKRPIALRLVRALSKNKFKSGRDIAKEIHTDVATVYRNLKVLRENQIIRPIGIGNKASQEYKVSFYGLYSLRSIELQRDHPRSSNNSKNNPENEN